MKPMLVEVLYIFIYFILFATQRKIELHVEYNDPNNINLYTRLQ